MLSKGTNGASDLGLRLILISKPGPIFHDCFKVLTVDDEVHDRITRRNLVNPGYLNTDAISFILHILCGKYGTKVPVCISNVLISDWMSGRNEREYQENMFNFFFEKEKVPGKNCVYKPVSQCKRLILDVFTRKGMCVSFSIRLNLIIFLRHGTNIQP